MDLFDCGIAWMHQAPFLLKNRLEDWASHEGNSDRLKLIHQCGWTIEIFERNRPQYWEAWSENTRIAQFFRYSRGNKQNILSDLSHSFAKTEQKILQKVTFDAIKALILANKVGTWFMSREDNFLYNNPVGGSMFGFQDSLCYDGFQYIGEILAPTLIQSNLELRDKGMIALKIPTSNHERIRFLNQ